MPITTYARPETLVGTEDADICEALRAVHGRVVVMEVPLQVPARHWWSSAHWQPGYQVLKWLWDTPFGPEWQVINFYREGSGTSVNTVVPKELVLTYLYGCGATQWREEPA